MEKKGICETCVYDKACVLNRIFPVWQCEEFSSEALKANTDKKGKEKIKFNRRAEIPGF